MNSREKDIQTVINAMAECHEGVEVDGEPYCIHCGNFTDLESHHKDCPVLVARDLLTRMED